MQAFAQFASDLDASTQRQLARGERLVELLKQPQYEPVPVEHQVLAIFAATQGLIDTIPVNQVKTYQDELIAYFESEHKTVIDELRATAKLDDSVRDGLTKGINSFNARFNA
jgi:F-type H+-transporting ATPase subunit alpha